MRIKVLLLFLIAGWQAMAQTDPVVMSVNGKAITRSEFEYAYKKNNKAEQHISVIAFAKQYALYKQKVAAAEEAKLDKQLSFDQEVASFLMPHNAPTVQLNAVSPELEEAAHCLYLEEQKKVDKNGGLVSYGEIRLRIHQHATADEEAKVRMLADSIYRALQEGASFELLAKQYSQTREGRIFFVAGRYEVLEEVEKALFTMQPGELRGPINSPLGLHILKMIRREWYPRYEEVRPRLIKQLEMANLRQQIIEQQQGKQSIIAVPVDISEEKETILVDENLRRELREGLLVAAITQQKLGILVNNKADLQRYVNKHKKEFRDVVKDKSGADPSLEEILPLVEVSYKQSLERGWEKELKRKYKVVVYKKVLSAINHK